MIRISDPKGVVEVMPHMLGYRPDNTAVIFGVVDGRFHSAMCAELPDPNVEGKGEESWASLMHDAASHFSDKSTDGILSVMYRDSKGGEEDGLSVVVELAPYAGIMADVLIAHGLPLHTVLCVSGDRWWNFFCQSDDCCPLDGTPISNENPGAVTAELVYEGVSVKTRTEDEIRQEWRPIEGDRAAVQKEAIREAVDADMKRSYLMEDDELEERTRELAASAMRQFEEGATHLAPGLTADVLIGLSDRLTRDAVLGLGIALCDGGQDVSHARRLYAYLASSALEPDPEEPDVEGSSTPAMLIEAAPAALSMLALMALWQKDTVGARIAIRRALEINPFYRLASLLKASLDTGVEMEALFRMMRSTLG
ncbi:DUF4192 domain-containing protein (plasmid) [Streptomyces sp. NBC_01186]|uniref:DUF4192 domain-containing protein n=1 Tax=Streptomyces sp. NBC_01186 TaxID=2903765 RepID=UPI002E0D3215|nr:DUF4192 domain-containing protein [Streptomyces sp. NBC_01186]